MYGNVTDLGLSTKLGSLRESNSSHFSANSSGFVPFSGQEETFHFRVNLSAKLNVWLVIHFWILLLPSAFTSGWQRSSVCRLPLLQSSVHTPEGVKALAQGCRAATPGTMCLLTALRLQQMGPSCAYWQSPPPSKFLSFVLEYKSVKWKVFNLADCRYSSNTSHVWTIWLWPVSKTSFKQLPGARPSV